MAFQHKNHEDADRASHGKVRLQRVMADAGVAARRACEDMIEAGRVEVNGEVMSKLPVFVDAEQDSILVDGRPLKKAERKLYIMFHKPPRTLVSNTDEPGMERATAISFVQHPAKPRLFPVGRLDYDTSGLLLLTNDGDLAHRLTHPRYGIPKTYLASIRGAVTAEFLADVAKKMGAMERRDALGALHSGRRLRPSVAERAARLAEGEESRSTPPSMRVVKTEGERTVVEISMTEAKNRQIQEVLKMLGAPIKKLTRVVLGPLTLRGLAPGNWRELSREELQLLRRAADGKWKPGDKQAGEQRSRESTRGKTRDGEHRRERPRESERAREARRARGRIDAKPARPVRGAPAVAAIPVAPARPVQRPKPPVKDSFVQPSGPRPRVLLPEARNVPPSARRSA